MLKIDWAGYGGAAGMGAFDGYIESGNAPAFVNNIADADLWADALVVGSQVLLGDKLRGWAGDALDGAAYAAVADATKKLMNKYVTTSSSSSGTGASVDYVMADAVAPAPQFIASNGPSFSQDY